MSKGQKRSNKVIILFLLQGLLTFICFFILLLNSKYTGGLVAVRFGLAQVAFAHAEELVRTGIPNQPFQTAAVAYRAQAAGIKGAEGFFIHHNAAPPALPILRCTSRSWKTGYGGAALWWMKKPSAPFMPAAWARYATAAV